MNEVNLSVTILALEAMASLERFSKPLRVFWPGPEKYRKFPPESTESIFLSSRLGVAPPVNLNLQILTYK